MSGIVGSRLNTRGSGIIGSLGTDGQILLSSGAGTSAVFETVSVGGDLSFGGDTFGADKVIGSNDSYTLSFETNNTTVLGSFGYAQRDGEIVMGGGAFNGAGAGYGQSSTIHLSVTTTDASGTAMFVNNTDGSISSPVAPTFHAEHSASQNDMSNSADTTITWGVEEFDIGANFTSNTFTAPSTGKYLLSHLVLTAAQDHDGSWYFMTKTITSNREYHWTYEIRSFMNTQPEFFPFHFSVVADMDASDTAHVVFRQAGGGDESCDVYGTQDHQHFFSGCMVA